MRGLTVAAVAALTATSATAQECQDLTGNSANGLWHDSDGPTYNCQWYSSQQGHCRQYGSSFANFGATANEACCYCGGGDASTTSAFAAGRCVDKDLPWNAEWHLEGDVTKNCAWFANDFDRCLIYGTPENGGLSAADACCTCNGGDSPFRCPFGEQYSPASASCVAISCRSENACSPGETCRAAEKPCVTAPCGQYECIAPIPEAPPASVSASEYIPKRGCGGCTDLTILENGTTWYDSDGPEYNCEWYAANAAFRFGTGCQYGDQYENFGLTANEACCACSDRVSIVEEPLITNLTWSLYKGDNERLHNTDHQSAGSKADLVLRRGQFFLVELVDGEDEDIVFELIPTLSGYDEPFLLDAVREDDEHTIALPANLPIGRYALSADERTIAQVVILFNPWVPEDIVYMPDAEEREEYIKNEASRYFSGNVYSYPRSLSVSVPIWQNNLDSVLDDVLDLLELTATQWEECGQDRTTQDFSSPIKVSRSMSYMGSSGAPSGVVQGRWDGEYEDGKQPGYWTGTKEIMDLWQEQGQKPIMYGQCWVFACTLNTFMRSLGIPARVVGNFNSAHDVPEGFMQTAYGVEANYDWIINETTADSVWNFHEWVNVWFTRPDLDEANIGLVPHAAGWNDIDSTPQEESDFKYQMGPSNHDDMQANYAKGNAYDNRFVMGEYNAYHTERGDEYIGRYTMTGKVNAPLDCQVGFRIRSPTDELLAECVNVITFDVKPAEPSRPPMVNETLSLRRDVQQQYMTDKESYLAHTFHAHAIKPMVGEPMDIHVSTHHLDVDMSDYEVDMELVSIEYTGAELSAVGRYRGRHSNNADKLVLRVPYRAYKQALSKSTEFRAKLTLRSLKDSEDVTTETIRISLDVLEPTLSADHLQKSLQVSWTNPMLDDVTNVQFIINTGGNQIVHATVDALAARETHSFNVEGICGAGAHRFAVVAVTCAELATPQAHATVEIPAC